MGVGVPTAGLVGGVRAVGVGVSDGLGSTALDATLEPTPLI